MKDRGIAVCSSLTSAWKWARGKLFFPAFTEPTAMQKRLNNEGKTDFTRVFKVIKVSHPTNLSSRHCVETLWGHVVCPGRYKNGFFAFFSADKVR
jgi:hypothetical protein